MKLLSKARRHPVGVALGSKVVGLNRVPWELGNNFIFHFLFFGQSQHIAIMIDLGKIFQYCLVNYNAINCDINTPL